MTNILIVDDDETIREMIGGFLERKEYTCILAADVAEARDCFEKQNCELILCDITMPGESGLDFIRDFLPGHQDVAIIMLTGIDDPLVAGEAIEIGAYDYIIKPFDFKRLLNTVVSALRRRELEVANRAYSENLEKMVADRTEKLRQALDGIIHAMALTVETRDPYTAGHQQRVTELALAIAKQYGLSEGKMEGLRMAGMIHDLGKIAIPAEILSKPGRLTEMEFNLLKAHPQAGYNILKEIEFPWPVAQMVLQHHERINGSGYPGGLSGKDILPEARILAVADVVEAMSSHRPYRPALGIDKALEEISKNKNISYDPKAVEACIKLFSYGGFELKPL
jgi:response regulator RpfG family c-di-GMP phosphodiesterase